MRTARLRTLIIGSTLLWSIGYWSCRGNQTPDAIVESPIITLPPSILDTALLQSLHYYRNLGFYEQFSDETDEFLLTKILGYLQLEYDGNPLRNTRQVDLDEFQNSFTAIAPLRDPEHIHLLKYDSARVLTDLSRYDPILDDKAYTRLFDKLERISGGSFHPDRVHEITNDRGQSTIVVTQDGERVQYDAATQVHDGSYGSNIEFDIGIVSKINESLVDSSHAFYFYSADMEEFGVPEMHIAPSTYRHYFFIVYLEKTARERLIAEKNWSLY
jgi:hypothetical protein